ncbi:MAG: TolC family protein [Pseudomonadota bacterium]
MLIKYKKSSLFIFGFLFCFSGFLNAQEANDSLKNENEILLDISAFIKKASQNDTYFEQILIDELSLKYKKDLLLPAKDLVLEVKTTYDFIFSQDRNTPETEVSLSKLFPNTATTFSLSHTYSPSFSSTDNSSKVEFSIAQPIVQNAFGKATRLYDKIIGLETDVARFQISEAYEDYLCTTIIAYYNWYEAYEYLEIAKSSYASNEKLLENIKARQKSKIAYEIDVNKIKVQLLSKKESLIKYEKQYENAFYIVKTALRSADQDILIPQKPDIYKFESTDFNEDIRGFKQKSRTFKILKLLEDKSSLEVSKYANELLPSLDFLFAYELSGDKLTFDDNNQMLYFGLSLNLPLPNQVKKATLENSKIAAKKIKLTANNIYYELNKKINELYININRQKALISLTQEKIKLAQKILKAEKENYTYGKVTLNDYIDAVNKLDSNRFNLISHEMLLGQLVIEKLRIMDQLISKPR